jgi:hypothetical protein
MTTEPTTDPPTPDGESTGDAPTVRTGEASTPKVTRARVKTSGAASGGRAKSTAKSGSASKTVAKAGSTSTPALAPATKLVPVPMATSDAGGGESQSVRADRVEITQGGADHVEATSVSITQGGIGNAEARTIDVHKGGIGRADATDIAVSAGGIGFAQGERVSVEMGALGVAIGDDVRVIQSVSSYVMARGDATVDQSFVNTLIADKVTLRQPSAVVLLIARQVDGSVRPLLDWRGALAAGAAAGLVMGLLRLGRR